MSVALWMAVKPLYMHSQWHYWGIDSEWSELLLDHLSLQELLKQKALWLKTLILSSLSLKKIILLLVSLFGFRACYTVWSVGLLSTLIFST